MARPYRPPGRSRLAASLPEQARSVGPLGLLRINRGFYAAAFAAVLLYRISTFYLPPIWGWVAMNWLRRNRYL